MNLVGLTTNYNYFAKESRDTLTHSLSINRNNSEMRENFLLNLKDTVLNNVYIYQGIEISFI